MNGEKIENVNCRVVSTGVARVTGATSITTESTCPCANMVTAHSCPAQSASLWINSCSAGHAAMASSNRTMATKSAATTCGPRDLNGCVTACKEFANYQ